ncbi:MAG: glycosyltransferase, partial [bacterium]
YMAAGIPTIASNFPLWREIVEGNQCGICVDPLDPRAIGEAIQYLIDNPSEAERLGRNGRKAVEEKFDWAIEEQRLSKLYRELLC